MVLFRQVFAAATCIASTVAVDIIVKSSGGNVTGKFGHPYGYGFLHEVSSLIPYAVIIHH
jgi:alpha-N-arabinofuranosidase